MFTFTVTLVSLANWAMGIAIALYAISYVSNNFSENGSIWINGEQFSKSEFDREDWQDIGESQREKSIDISYVNPQIKTAIWYIAIVWVCLWLVLIAELLMMLWEIDFSGNTIAYIILSVLVVLYLVFPSKHENKHVTDMKDNIDNPQPWGKHTDDPNT